MRTRIRQTRVGGLAAAAAALAALAGPAPAALGAAGDASLTLNGAAAKTLRASGVRIAPLGAAHGGARRVTLPVRAGLVGSTTTVLRLGGGLSLSRGKERVRLAGLRLTLGSRSGVSGKLGGERTTLFRVLAGGRRVVDSASGSVALAGLRLALTRQAVETIAAQFELRRLPARFGVLSASREGLLAGGQSPGSSGPQSSGCPLPSSAGPAPEDPLPVATRPAGALDITSATVSWDVRESFIRYVNTGEGTTVFDGATASAPELRAGASTPLTYSFQFPFASGWHHPGADSATAVDDRAALYFTGGVRFLYSAHGIDLRTSAPELELGGGASRAIFAVADGEAAPERQVIVNLYLARAAAVAVSGATVTYERVPGAIPAGTASSVFAGFYAPGTDFGCFTVSYSTAS